MSGSIVQVTLKSNQTFKVNTQKRQNKPYWMVGKEQWMNLEMNKSKKPDWQYSGIDFLNEFAAMSAGERTVVLMMKDLIKWDTELQTYNLVVTVTEDLPICEQHNTTYEMFLKSYRKLFQKDLVRRVSKGKYMFNPEFLLPSSEGPIWVLQWNGAKQHPNPVTYGAPNE